MIIQPTRVENALGVNLQKIYQTNATNFTEKTCRKDILMISKFSALVELGMKSVSELPDIRAGVVNNARIQIENGLLPGSNDIAGAMINRAVERQV